ncbi:hypothetical protein [Sphingosinicella terrae]|uniref:hypothetical protein n=1 Tax=Sphingosinicella terrae TaxID=2172047 RepID=UPI000E0D7D04|nr:hypothetical protein [Sphingosinicella terrae]
MPTVNVALPRSLMASARQFWGWWTEELRSAAPEAVRRWTKPVPRAEIEPARAGTIVDVERDGLGERHVEERPLEELDAEGWSQLHTLVAGTRARIVLAPPDVFVTRLTLPAAARGRLRTAVSLRLGQIAPVNPEQLAWSCRIVGESGRELEVAVAMARRERIEAVAALFEARAMAPPPMVARIGVETIELASGADGSHTPERRQRRHAAVLAALLLASIPATSWTAATLLAWVEERHALALHEDLAPRLAAERALAREAQTRSALRIVLELPSATSLIEGLALGLPDSAFAVSAERHYDGRFTFEAQTTDRAALESAVAESELLASVHSANVAPIDGEAVRLSFAGMPR